MTSINPIKSTAPTPPRRNAAEAWTRKYLNTLSDWRTYMSPDGGSLEERAENVTENFFGPKILKGAVFLLGAHACQQITASAATIIARDWLRGEELGTHRGITVRKLRFAGRKSRQPKPQTETLRREFSIFAHFSGLGNKAEAAKARASRKIQLQDSYTFTEGGRAWLCTTLRFPTPRGEADRLLSSLILLSFPNRGAYFDRLLPFDQAVEIARGRILPDAVPGFVGDTTELDILFPLLRPAKLALYGLNWYLIDPAERDNPDPDETAGYAGLVPPGSGGSSGSKNKPYTTLPRRGNRQQLHTPNFGFNSSFGQVTPPPPPDYFGAPSMPGTPIQSSFLPGQSFQTGQNTASANLGAAPVNVAIQMENKNGSHETVWVTVEEDAYQVLDTFNRPTGLSIAPAVSLDSKGNFTTHPAQWHIVHAETGKLLNPNPLSALHQARQLADRLIGLFDWRRPFDQITPQEREQVRAALQL